VPNQLVRSALIAIGCVLAGAFFVPWVDVGGDTASGWWIASNVKHWLFLVPLSGLALAGAAASRSHYTRLAAVVAGVLVAGDVGWNIMRDMVRADADLWLMLGGAVIVLAGVAEERRLLRAVGGLAALLGFFAPWSSHSLYAALTDEMIHFVIALGVSVKVLWLIPVAGGLAVVSAGIRGPNGKRLAAASGIAIAGSLVWVIGSTANLILGWGAWLTLGASTAALLLGILAPGIGAASKPRA
jgi:hypothetical protein